MFNCKECNIVHYDIEEKQKKYHLEVISVRWVHKSLDTLISGLLFTMEEVSRVVLLYYMLFHILFDIIIKKFN